MDTKTWKEFASKKSEEIKTASDNGETNLTKILGIDESFEEKLMGKVFNSKVHMRSWSDIFAFAFGEFDSPEEAMMALFQLTANAKEA